MNTHANFWSCKNKIYVDLLKKLIAIKEKKKILMNLFVDFCEYFFDQIGYLFLSIYQWWKSIHN